MLHYAGDPYPGGSCYSKTKVQFLAASSIALFPETGISYKQIKKEIKNCENVYMQNISGVDRFLIDAIFLKILRDQFFKIRTSCQEIKKEVRNSENIYMHQS